jgi:hypothetical protein
MDIFTYKCVTLEDVCEQNTLDYGHVMEDICHSDISFGTNEDTLISKSMLEEVLDIHLDFGGLDDGVLISLGS